MIRLTCPECQTRCRINRDQLNHNTSHGRCPECGHRFPLPATAEQPDIKQNEIKRENRGKNKNFGVTLKDSVRTKIMGLGKKPLFISLAGIGLILLLLTIYISTNRPGTSVTKNNRENITKAPALTVLVPQPKTAALKTEELRLDPELRSRAIAQIKHHALVADADIILDDHLLQLSLLVSGNTPPNYSGRLGCQFVHYVKELLPQDQPQPLFRISVYYPDGTRIEVPICDHFFEEEVIQDMGNKE